VQPVLTLPGETACVQAVKSEETEEQNPIPILPGTLAKIVSTEAIGTETQGTGRVSMKGASILSNSKYYESRVVKVTRNEIGLDVRFLFA
jgi:hypothetical protein